MIRKRIVFSGRVQGVGFRYRARFAANALRLTGWVKNEWDGTVLMEVQGKAGDIAQLIRELQSDRYIRIDHMDSKMIPVEYHESSFGVKGY